MNRIFMLVIAVLMVCAVGYTQSMSTANEVAPMPVGTNPIISFPTPATPTLALTGAVAQAMPAMPVGSKGVIVRAASSAAVNFGGSAVLSGAGYAQIAADTQKEFYFSALRQPTIYFFSNATGTAVTLRFTPFK